MLMAFLFIAVTDAISLPDRQTLPLRKPRAVTGAPRRLHGGLQFCPSAQDAQRPYALRIHCQYLGVRAGQVHRRPDPPDAGTKHLDRFYHLNLIDRSLNVIKFSCIAGLIRCCINVQ